MKESNILASENFSCGNKHYFLDFRIAKNNINYISITRSDSQPDGTYTKQCVRIFEEDFHVLIGCMSSLFRSAVYYDQRDVRVQDLYRMNRDRSANGIKSWELQLRPREKMLEHGREAMGNSELLAMLIGSGTPNETAVDLAGRILDSVGGDLIKLSDMSLDELCGFAGMGVAKSSSILAAIELSRRMYPMLNVAPVRKMRIANGAVMGLRSVDGFLFPFMPLPSARAIRCKSSPPKEAAVGFPLLSLTGLCGKYRFIHSPLRLHYSFTRIYRRSAGALPCTCASL